MAAGSSSAIVANALQISAQAVSKWERGENAPDISVLLT
ncbi:MAG: helix-turn-helix transcriptional regulator [Planctomycetota bacterium]